jgi:hypothetical protein
VTADGLCLGLLSAADVSSFLVRECPRRSASRARNLVCALRSLLRYLLVVGVIETPLVWAVPSVADLRDRTLPRGLEPAAVTRDNGDCDVYHHASFRWRVACGERLVDIGRFAFVPRPRLEGLL